MSLVIWKYPLEVTDEQQVMMPDAPRMLTVQVQDGTPALWALVDPDRISRARLIVTVGTGHPTPALGFAHYVGTYQLKDGALVFHVFDGGPGL